MAVKIVKVIKTQKNINTTCFCPHKENTYVKLRTFLQNKLKYLTSFTGLQHLHNTAAVRQTISTDLVTFRISEMIRTGDVLRPLDMSTC